MQLTITKVFKSWNSRWQLIILDKLVSSANFHNWSLQLAITTRLLPVIRYYLLTLKIHALFWAERRQGLQLSYNCHSDDFYVRSITMIILGVYGRATAFPPTFWKACCWSMAQFLLNSMLVLHQLFILSFSFTITLMQYVTHTKCCYGLPQDLA